MDNAEIERRIRAVHHIGIAGQESVADSLPLVDVIMPAAEFMTREELIEQLRRVCEAYDRQAIDQRVFRANGRLREENMLRELEAEREKRRSAEAARDNAEKEIAARDSIIRERDKTIKTMAATLKDITHTSETLRQEKFASGSKNPNLLPGVLPIN